MTAPTLSKSKILSGLQCHKRLWLELNKPGAKDDNPELDARLNEGTAAGVVARGEWPDGLLADENDYDVAIAMTDAWRKQPDRPLFEGFFSHDGVRIRPDALVPNGDGTIDLYEVKSSTAVKPYHRTDVTVQSWVLRQLGIPLRRTHLTHIDNQFVYSGSGDYRGLFTHADLTDVAQAGAADVPGWVIQLRAVLEGAEPDVAPGTHCGKPFDCPYRGYCGVERVTNANHPWVKAGQAVQNNDAARKLAALPWPRHYLDFETVMFAVPFWIGTRPYQQIPFQWSCHTEREDGTVAHNEFLAEAGEAPFRAFADSVIAAVAEEGPVLVYNAGFEKRVLREAAERVPERAAELLAICDRIVDLLDLTRKSWYHPDMHGSWSLKAVLPTISDAPGYGDLDGVAHGGDAMRAIAEYIRPETSPERRIELADSLRAYCALDTLAMVRLAKHLASL